MVLEILKTNKLKILLMFNYFPFVGKEDYGHCDSWEKVQGICVDMHKCYAAT